MGEGPRSAPPGLPPQLPRPPLYLVQSHLELQDLWGGGDIGNPDNADLRVSPSLPPWPPLDPCPPPQHFYPASVSSQERSRWGPVPGKGLGDSGG